MDQLNQGLSVPGGLTSQMLMMSGNPQFSTIYSGSPLPTDVMNSSNTPGAAACQGGTPGEVTGARCVPQTSYPVYTGLMNPPPGPFNTAQFSNLTLGQLYSLYSAPGNNSSYTTPQYPTWAAGQTDSQDQWFAPLTNSNSDYTDPSLTGFVEPPTNGTSSLMYQAVYPTTESFHTAMSTWTSNAPGVVTPSKPDPNGNVAYEISRGQDWLFPVVQGQYFTMGIPGAGYLNGSNKGGQYAAMVVPYPIYDTGGVYNPKPDDVITACNSPGWSLSPSYSFLSYCTKDIVVPNADNSGTVTIPCPTQQTTDASGRPVTAPGIVCVQGSDSDAFQLSMQTPVGTGAGNSHGTDGVYWWMQADIAPSCTDVYLGPSNPTSVLDPSQVGQMTGMIPKQNSNQYPSPNYCFGKPDVIDGLSDVNMVPKCMAPPPQNTVYQNVYVKNVCLSQLPFEQWGQYASLSNAYPTTPATNPQPTTTNFVAPGQGQTSSFDVFERHWMALPMHTGKSNGKSVDGEQISLGAYMANSDGSMVKGGPYGQYNYYYGYQQRSPAFFASMAQEAGGGPIPTGIAQMNDMSPYYNQYNLTSFQGNLGAVPGSSESLPTNSPLARNPTWQQRDYTNWT